MLRHHLSQIATVSTCPSPSTSRDARSTSTSTDLLAKQIQASEPGVTLENSWTSRASS